MEKDLTSSLGAGYRYLSLKAPSILDSSRSANPHQHCGRWAFDIDGLVFVTAIPYASASRAKGAREAREVLEAVLSRALQLADANGWHRGIGTETPAQPLRRAAADARHATPIPAASYRDAVNVWPPESRTGGISVPSSPHSAVSAGLRLDSPLGGGSKARETAQGTRTSAQPNGTKTPDANTRALDAALDAAHYTRLPEWALSGELPLTVSERILLADVLDVMGPGASLSYKADRAAIGTRTGLKASTATAALRALCEKGILEPVAGARGRFIVAWARLSDFARLCPAGARRMGAALTEADARRRLSDPAKGLALPVWAVQLCGATEAALLLAKAWAMAHGGGDGRVWAAGTTLASWLPGNERSLRRARASLVEQGLAHTAKQYTYQRLYNTGIAKNKTVEIAVTAPLVARALAVRGIDFGADLTAVVRSFFADDASLAAEAAAWDARKAVKSRLRALRRGLAALALQGSLAALKARTMLDAGSASRARAPWRPVPLKALPSAA